MGNSNSTGTMPGAYPKEPNENRLTKPSQQAHPYEPNHSVTIEYPCTYLLNHATEEFQIFTPNVNQDRYEPLPLTPHPTAIPLNDESEASHTSLNKTDSVFQGIFEPALDLVDDMSRCTSHIGRTLLRMVTYSRDDDAIDQSPTRIKMRIERYTEFYTGNGQTIVTVCTTYETDLASYYANLQATMPAVDDWQYRIHNLLYQTDDRAALHVKLQLLSQGLTYEDVYAGQNPWLPPRTLPIDEGIKMLGTVLGKAHLAIHNAQQPLDERLTHCPSCTEEYRDAETSPALLLRCSMKHSVCYNCFKDWATRHGLASIRCFYCAQQLATPEMEARLGPNSLDMEATFRNDPRYTQHENFERSCADLDLESARTNSTLVKVDAKLLAGAWKNLIDRAPPSEPRLRDHIHPRNMHEYNTLLDAFEQTIKAYDGQVMEIQQLYQHMKDRLSKLQRGEIVRFGLDKFLGAEQMKLMQNDPAQIPQRPGFEIFAERSINRVLQFLTVRKCCEKHDSTSSFQDLKKNPKGYHRHGDRFFWASKATLKDGKNRTRGEK